LWNCESAAIALEKQRNAGKRNLKVFDKSSGTVEQWNYRKGPVT
jgi:hypothetical protein